jgi:hypothetical protein
MHSLPWCQRPIDNELIALDWQPVGGRLGRPKTCYDGGEIPGIGMGDIVMSWDATTAYVFTSRYLYISHNGSRIQILRLKVVLHSQNPNTPSETDLFARSCACLASLHQIKQSITLLKH